MRLRIDWSLVGWVKWKNNDGLGTIANRGGFLLAAEEYKCVVYVILSCWINGIELVGYFNGLQADSYINGKANLLLKREMMDAQGWNVFGGHSSAFRSAFSTFDVATIMIKRPRNFRLNNANRSMAQMAWSWIVIQENNSKRRDIDMDLSMTRLVDISITHIPPTLSHLQTPSKPHYEWTFPISLLHAWSLQTTSTSHLLRNIHEGEKHQGFHPTKSIENIWASWRRALASR